MSQGNADKQKRTMKELTTAAALRGIVIFTVADAG
jgi:hypothetical protein